MNVDATLQRIEALPGQGRYAVTFQRLDGSEHTATATVDDTGVEVAEAALPTGWRRDGAPWQPVAAAVTAFDAARRDSAPRTRLRDLPGGWDVSLGNVVLDNEGRPSCTAHGPLTETPQSFSCEDCGAQALFG